MLVEDAKDRVPARATTDHREWATVRWTAQDGAAYTDEARVPSRTPAGSTVTVWTDASGHITSEPLTHGEARLHVAAGGAVLGAGWVVRLTLEQRRLAGWAEEWERIDTRWGWKTG